MVNVGRGNPLSQGDFYPSRENWSRNDRQYIDIPQDGRFSTPSIHGYPQAIETALRDCAQIPVKEFALIVLLENGEEKTYSSTSLKPHWSKIFSERFKRDFHHCANGWVGTDGSYPSSAYGQEGMYSELEFDSAHGYRKQSSSGDSSSGLPRRYRPRQPRSEDSSDDLTSGKRKRTHYLADDDTPIPPVQKFQHLTIGDEAEVEKFYHVRFKDMQQSSCKVMGKAFVKLVEPKKQTHYPYTKGNPKAPPWWPPMTGDNQVRHREPDHLLKPERIRLLVHILRMIVQPAGKQCSAVQKLGLNVRKLEEVTMEAMSNWFNDKDHPENATKRPFLKEIFKVAKAEERYLNGEIDDTASIPIMYGERGGGDDSDGDDEDLKEEDEEDENPPISSHMSTPESLVSPSMIQAPNQHPQFETEAQNIMQQRSRPLIVSRHTQPSHMEDQTGYIDSNFSRTMGTYQTQSPSIHKYQQTFPTTSFPSPPQNMYSGGWPNNNILSNPSMSANYCVTSSSQAALAPPAASFQLPAPHPQPQQNMLPPPGPMAHHTYNDGLPNSRQYDSGPALGSQLRTGSLGHPHQMHQGHAFGEFLQDTSGFGTTDSDMKEEHIRPS